MDRLSKLAALQQLRASGALSDSEFEAQKQALLAPRRPGWIAAAAVLVAVLAVAAFLALRPASRNDTAVPTTNAAAPAAPAPETAEAAPPAPAESGLAAILKPEILGARLAYWENIAGPARQRFGRTGTYSVAGCDVEVETDTGGAISSIAFSPSATCDADLSPFFSVPLGRASALRIADLKQRGNPEFRADCISMCGNAADPVVEAISGGSRADEFHSLVAGITLASDEAIAASNKWEAAMRRAGRDDDYIQSAGFNCDKSFDDAAMAAFGALRPDRIKILSGYPNTDSDGCGSGD